MASREQDVPSRRVALTGLGVTGLGVAAAMLPTRASAVPDGADETASRLQAVTIAELRAATDPDPAALYFVTDPGQQGPFSYDADDTRSADNTGVVLVSEAGHRFKRVVTGALQLDWFGAVADYNPRNGNGTASDDALDLALAALEDFASQAAAGGGSKRGLPTIELSAGNYLFRRPGHAIQWDTGVTGLHLRGQGMHQTSVYVDAPQEEHGEANHFLVNDGRERENLGVVNTYVVDDIAFRGVSGTERFIFYGDTPGAGVAKYMYFDRCSWRNFAVSVDIGGRVNSDHLRFLECQMHDEDPEAVFLLADNPQSQNHDFVSCHFFTRGTTFKFRAGGNLHVRGCQVIVQETGRFLHIEDPTGERIGIGNGTYNLTDVNAEVHNRGRLLYVDAPEANVTFLNGRFITGQGQKAADWEPDRAYAEGDLVRVGVRELEYHSKQRVFRCTQAHTSSAETRPRTGQEWESVWASEYELEIHAGAVQIRGGSLSLSTLLTYGNASYDSAALRPTLTISDGCRLVNPVADLVDVVPTEEITHPASRGRVIATGCRPFTGMVPGAYAATPYDPVDVSLNAEYGFEGAIPPVNRHVVTGSPEGGLPTTEDGEVTFRLPRGAHVLSVRLVSNELRHAQAYRVTNHDGTRTFLPDERGERAAVQTWYAVDSEEARTFRLTSRASERAEGFLLVEYI